MFLIVILILHQVPAPLRNLRRIWILEAAAATVLIIILTAITEFILISFKFFTVQNEIGPIVSVPLFLTSAYMLNRAMRIFIWQGLLARKARAVPKIIVNVFDVLVYVAAMYAIFAFVFNQPMTGIIVSTGVVVGILGLSFQPILGDVIAGISLSIERPFSIGDLIKIDGGIRGTVVEMDWRATLIQTPNNTIHVVPNGKLSNISILNYDRPDKVYAFWFFVTISRTVPPTLVRRLLLEAALKSNLVLDEPSPFVRIADADDRPIRYRIFVYCSDYLQHFAAKDEVLQNAWGLLTKAGFNFSASPQDIEIRRGETHEATELEADALLKEVPLLNPLKIVNGPNWRVMASSIHIKQVNKSLWKTIRVNQCS